jgi:phosphohistidine phosphatase
LRRAQQTAEIIAATLDPAGRVEVDAAFIPEEDPQVAAARLVDAPDPSLFVGHLPHLGRLVSLLVGRLEADPVTFHAGTVVCLERIEGVWGRLWVLDPPVGRGL